MNKPISRLLASILVLSTIPPALTRAEIRTPIHLKNVGMCEMVFGTAECANQPDDVSRGIKNLKKSGESAVPEIVKIGARAVPALLDLAGEKRLSFFVVGSHGFAPIYWYAPYSKVAGTALYAAFEADPASPVFKRIALGTRNWFQDGMWRHLVDKQVAFTLPEAKLLFHSQFLFLGEQYGWPAILKICLQLPPDQAAEAFMDGAQTLQLGDLKYMGEVDWKRLDELLDAFVKVDSIHALYYLFQLRRECNSSNPQSSDWLQGVLDRKEHGFPESRPQSDRDRLAAAYEKRLILLLAKYRVPKEELEINSRYFPNPGPSGTFWRLTRYQISFESPIPGGESNRTGQMVSPRYHEVLTDVLVNGRPAIYEDGAFWAKKPVTLGWQNPQIYSKSFSFVRTSTTSFSAYEPLELRVWDKLGKKDGDGRGMGTVVWKRRIDGAPPPNHPARAGGGQEESK